MTTKSKEDALQTYTHLAIGGLLGGLFFSHEPIAMAACCAGSIAPDFVAATFYITDSVKSKPLKINPLIVVTLTAISHSLLLQLGLVLIALFLRGYLGNEIFAFAIGGISHLLLDAITHVDPQWQATDPGFLWPLHWRLQLLIGWQDYRCNPFSIFRIKKFEQVILILALAGIILLLIL